MMTVNKRERRLIGAALIVGLGLIIYFYGVEPLQEWRRSGADMIPSREAQLERRRLIVAQRSTLTTEIEKVNQQLLTRAPRWLQGPTPPLAASELQTLVKDVASRRASRSAASGSCRWSTGAGCKRCRSRSPWPVGCGKRCASSTTSSTPTKILTVQDVKVRVVAVGQPRDLLTTFNVSGYLPPEHCCPDGWGRGAGGTEGIISLSKKILALNVVLAAVAVFLGIWLVRDLAATRPLPASPAARKPAGAAGARGRRSRKRGPGATYRL